MADIDSIWPGWQAQELIGQGAYGKVYRISRTERGHVSYAAAKLIEIPQDSSEVSGLQDMGMDEASIRNYYETTVQAIINEIAVMESLKGAPNIVTIEDYRFIEHVDEVGWTVCVRMELLQSLSDYHKQHGAPTVDEVIEIGVDVCNALVICENVGIIHRDVKPENVFRSAFDEYKLGDFGISRQIEGNSKSVYSQRGTSPYMAPEVVRGEKYSNNVDVYSLGIMLYRFLNGMRFPFLPQAPQPFTSDDVEQAMMRRLRGDALPAPRDADAELSSVILKACAADSSERYASAGEFRAALMNLRQKRLYQTPVNMDGSSWQKEKTEVGTSGVIYRIPKKDGQIAGQNADDLESELSDTERSAWVPLGDLSVTERKKVRGKLVALGALALLLVVAIALAGPFRQLLPQLGTEDQESEVEMSASAIEPLSTAVNLSPFFSQPVGDTSYWIVETGPYVCVELEHAGVASNGHPLTDGWAHFEVDGRLGIGFDGIQTDKCYNNLLTRLNTSLAPGTDHTFLIEVRNCHFQTGSFFCVWPVTMAELDERVDQFHNAQEAVVTGDGEWRITAKTLSSYSDSTRMTDGYIYVNSDTYVSFDIRISLYEGDYKGPYVPYVG